MELLFALELLFIMFELLFELLVTKIVLSWSNAPYQRCSSMLEWDVWHWYGPMLRTNGARVCATGCDCETC